MDAEVVIDQCRACGRATMGSGSKLGGRQLLAGDLGGWTGDASGDLRRAAERC